jgi:HJR/Mrr/RecB family endonuclease
MGSVKLTVPKFGKFASVIVNIKRRSKANEALGTLAQDEREAVIMYLVEGFPKQEVADSLGKSIAIIDRLLQAALFKLLSIPDEQVNDFFRSLFIERQPPLHVTDVLDTVKKLTPELIYYLKTNETNLDKIPPDVFEHLIGEFLLQRGFDEVRLVGRDSKTSADILAVKTVAPIESEVRYYVEVKRWKKKIGIEVVNSVYGAMLLEQPEFGWSAAMIVSLAGFKENRKTTALKLRKLNLVLKQRDDIVRWLREYAPRSNGLWLPATEFVGDP